MIKALKDFPILNSSLEGDTIVQKKAINIGMAAAMADGNLIVPVIKNADHLNLVGLAKAVNDLAHRARTQQLKPEEIQDGTFTLPMLVILDLYWNSHHQSTTSWNRSSGCDPKKPAVIETHREIRLPFVKK